MAALISVQDFFAEFAAEIVELQKQTLKEVVVSNQATQNLQWKQAQNFFVSDYDYLTVEDKDLLEDWEFALCNMTALESVAFLPRLQRCFQRVDPFISEKAEAIKELACKNLKTALQRKHMLQFPMSTFARIFLERYKDKLSTGQMDSLSMWEENLCALSTVDREAVTARRVAALISVQDFFAEFAAEIVELQKQTLKEVVVSNQATQNLQWKQAQNFFVRDYEYLAVEDKDLLEDWEFALCNMIALESVAFLRRLTRSFDRVKAIVGEQKEKLRLQEKVSLVDVFLSADTQAIPMLCFCGVFLKRYFHRLLAPQVAQVEVWERELP